MNFIEGFVIGFLLTMIYFKLVDIDKHITELESSPDSREGKS